MCKAVTAMLPKAAGRPDVYSTAESDPKQPVAEVTLSVSALLEVGLDFNDQQIQPSR